MIFKQSSPVNLITLRDRKSRFMIALKNEGRSPSAVAEFLIRSLTWRYKTPIKSFTFDNDIGFFHHGK